MQRVKQTQSIAQLVTQSHLDDQTKKAEVKVGAFIVEHNLPFQITYHLSDLVSEAFPDSKIAQ